MLTALAARFNVCVRDVDTVARFGSDKLDILLDDVAAESDIRNLAIKILAAITPAFEIVPQQPYITASQSS